MADIRQVRVQSPLLVKENVILDIIALRDPTPPGNILVEIILFIVHVAVMNLTVSIMVSTVISLVIQQGQIDSGILI